MRPRALVVDDDIPTRDRVKVVLEGEGLAVDAVSDGEAAIALLKVETYALVLLNLVLPTISGTDVMEYLKKHYPSSLARTIVVTGVPVSEINKLFPTVRYALTRPTGPARLRKTIRELLRKGEDTADVVVA